jgi:hypothetical protein
MVLYDEYEPMNVTFYLLQNYEKWNIRYLGITDKSLVDCEKEFYEGAFPMPEYLSKGIKKGGGLDNFVFLEIITIEKGRTCNTFWCEPNIVEMRRWWNEKLTPSLIPKYCKFWKRTKHLDAKKLSKILIQGREEFNEKFEDELIELKTQRDEILQWKDHP